MSRKGESWLSWTLTTIGLVGTGFAAGLHRLVWGLFLVLAVLWCLFFLLIADRHGGEPSLYFFVAFGPPIVVGIVVRLIEKIVFAFFGGLANADPARQPSPAEEKKRQHLGH